MLAAEPLLRRFFAIVARLTGLLGLARDRYRPEQHYMRGPGPKWHAKQQGNAI